MNQMIIIQIKNRTLKAVKHLNSRKRPNQFPKRAKVSVQEEFSELLATHPDAELAVMLNQELSRQQTLTID